MPAASCLTRPASSRRTGLSETGRREIRHLLKSVELALVALSLPTRRPFDTPDQLDDRIRRADGAFAMAYELGTKVVLVRAGAVPPEDEPARREAFTTALRDLGSAGRAPRRAAGARDRFGAGRAAPGIALETMDLPALAASIDPAARLQTGVDPIASVRELAALGRARLCQRCGSLFRFRRTQPARVRVSARCAGLGRVPGRSGRDRLSTAS